jgi:hypothetical protein
MKAKIILPTKSKTNKTKSPEVQIELKDREQKRLSESKSLVLEEKQIGGK